MDNGVKSGTKKETHQEGDIWLIVLTTSNLVCLSNEYNHMHQGKHPVCQKEYDFNLIILVV